MIETARLVLHPYTPILASMIADGAPRDPRWAPDYPFTGDRDTARMYLRAGAPGGLWVPYAVQVRDSGVFVGGAGFHGAPDGHGIVEIGYGLAESARGLGYATEAARALVEAAAAAGARRVVAELEFDNPPSAAVLARLGFTAATPLHWFRELH
ncbi:GNAT family N-acetyltransferase [Catellatospora sp. KI3]|uniref:GNAT family N-acetyltransferase n=1 Tax=Catellatospora sp. KI3 TaxID=3041620 RepID=UPI002482E58A|nr:GNAT family N-acetyltransferase [Catellatospora sp. KI3]MDI1463630.1 GNAT family N-acetyltransferase [Catellatospora sp. KI3]